MFTHYMLGVRDYSPQQTEIDIITHVRAGVKYDRGEQTNPISWQGSSLPPIVSHICRSYAPQYFVRGKGRD